MSLKIIKAGILDTLQDLGRFGYQHTGINPAGVMDRFSARLANSLLGRQPDAAVLELHFPAARILFEKAAVIALAGADFSPQINGRPVPLLQPIAIGAQSLLSFERHVSGARCYVALLQGFAADQWLNSFSTNLKAGAGGWKGRALLSGDRLDYQKHQDVAGILKGRELLVLPWKVLPRKPRAQNRLRFIRGQEWNRLTPDSIGALSADLFHISRQADRMGYRLIGTELKVRENRPLLSAPVDFGTMQLLPDGQLIVLMADHQTTGGYPRVGNVISCDLPLLAQLQPNESISFETIDLDQAEREMLQENAYLQEMALACQYQITNYTDWTK